MNVNKYVSVTGMKRNGCTVQAEWDKFEFKRRYKILFLIIFDQELLNLVTKELVRGH